jgi:glutathione S-transferase
MAHELYSISYSPWSERARFSLDVCNVPFINVDYQPPVSELSLRLRLRDLRGKLTLPVLFVGGSKSVLRDSKDIARFASSVGNRPEYFIENDEEFERILRICDTIMEKGRIRTTRRMQKNRIALKESLPWYLRCTAPLGIQIAKIETNRLLAKYGSEEETDSNCLRIMQECLLELQQKLQNRKYLFNDHLTFADISASAALAFIKPHNEYNNLNGPQSILMWSESEDLQSQFHELLLWRDEIYSAHRK